MSRPHLSIGEVLTILHAEFPDITISKIRFLESQGLIEPERTPSGYRRFYEPDLSRLRWILFQQRDHFLPLKVIKDRLDSGFIPPGREDDLRAVAGAAAPSGSAAEDTPEEVLGDVQSSDVQSSAAQSSAVQSGAVQSGVRETTAGRPAVRAMSVPAGGAGPDGVSQPELALGGADPVAAADGLAPADLEPTSYPEPAGYEGEASTTDGAPEYGDNDVADDATSGTAGEGNISDFSSWTPPRLSRPPRRADGEDASAGSRLTGDLSSVSLTLRELAAASGVEPAVLEELSRYGVISGRVVAGETVYGDEALIAARLAGRFAVYGIEPRHLRSYRVAADKEMALFEQVVAPLVRQRHPQGARAGDNLAELGELGEQLRRVLLRRIAREYLAGD